VSYGLDIRPDALADIEEAAKWHEEQQPGPGADFAHTVLRAIDSLPANPLMHRMRDRRRNVRWFLSPRFSTGSFIERGMSSSRSLPYFTPHDPTVIRNGVHEQDRRLN
jgi:plasmid stabilization system protein ParE